MTIRLTDKKVLLSHPFVSVTETKLSHPSSRGGWSPAISRINIDRGDAAAVLIHGKLKSEHRLVLVRQFRFPTYNPSIDTPENGWLVELVAGVIAAGEPPAVTARRETEEETGIQVDRLEHISSFFLSPGGSSERIHLFYGRLEHGLEDVDLDQVHGVDDEETSLVLFSPAEFLDAVDDNSIEDAKTIAASGWIRRHSNIFGLGEPE